MMLEGKSRDYFASKSEKGVPGGSKAGDII